MNEGEEQLSKEAVKEIRKKANDLIARFAALEAHPQQQFPAAVFMAGSPGAGKTEFSKSLIRILGDGVVRIDPDEVRKTLSQYKPGNAHLFQNAVNIGVDTLFYSALKNQQDFILDGTMANYGTAQKNIDKTLAVRPLAHIFYIYQDPVLAWKFTQDREKEEGRNITKESFIRAFVSSKENINKIKVQFGEKIRLHLIIKDYDNGVADYKINSDQIDNYLKVSYSKDELERLIHE